MRRGKIGKMNLQANWGKETWFSIRLGLLKLSCLKRVTAFIDYCNVFKTLNQTKEENECKMPQCAELKSCSFAYISFHVFSMFSTQYLYHECIYRFWQGMVQTVSRLSWQRLVTFICCRECYILDEWVLIGPAGVNGIGCGLQNG